MQKQKLLAIFLLISTVYILYPSTPQMSQDSANFSQNDKANLRTIILKATTFHYPNYDAIANYIKKQVTYIYSTQWNVLIYRQVDYASKRFYLSGLYGQDHPNKRYFQVTDYSSYEFSVLILQGIDKKTQKAQKLQFYPIETLTREIQSNSLQYTRRASERVLTYQANDIDIALANAYTSTGPDLVKFTQQAYKQIKIIFADKDWQRWDLCTSQQDMPNFVLKFTTPQYNEKWIDFSYYGPSEKWHITVWSYYTYQ